MKLWIAGTASYFPDTVLPNDCIQRLSGDEAVKYGEQYGVASRRTSLPIEYIEETQNADCWEARRRASANATDYAARAAEKALERAGISAEDLGLIIGDTPTPLEVTPSEGQRVGNRLQVKIPAYDMTAGTAAFSVALSRFLTLKEERAPDYILWVSTTIATQSLEYSGSLASGRFGDGAAAVVLSKKSGHLEVLSASCKPALWCYDEAHFPINKHIRCDAQYANDAAQAVKELYEEAEADRYFGSFLTGGHVDVSIETINEFYGDCLGASAPAVLAQEWDSLSSGQRVRLLCAGAGSGVGSVQLQVV